jgi:hypothetical protein
MSKAAESVVSRPSQTKCADSDSAENSGSTAESGEAVGESIQRIIENCEAEYGELARKALSAVPEHRLRKSVTQEIRGAGDAYRSKTVKGALKAFLRWFAEQEDTKIVGVDVESGNEIVWPAECSYDDSYLSEKYGVLKDGERAFLESENPHSSMLTLTGSNLNSQGKPRSPGDHLVDLKDSYGRFVRRELDRTMDGLGFDRYDGPEGPDRWWEYAVVAEPHKSGYIHLHIAVFTSHEVSASDFEPVMSKHVEKCGMAGIDAHRNDPCSEHSGGDRWEAAEPSCDDCHNPVSVRSVEEGVDNLGSYIAEYLGPCGEEIWDLPVNQLIAFTALWGTGQRRIHFSEGYHRAADRGQEIRGAEPDESDSAILLKGLRVDGEDYPLHHRQRCTECGYVHDEGMTGGECIECGCTDLVSASSSHMRPIRGIPGGDPPAERGTGQLQLNSYDR